MKHDVAQSWSSRERPRRAHTWTRSVTRLSLCAVALALGARAEAQTTSAPRYFSHPNYANSPLPAVTAGTCLSNGATCSSSADCPALDTCAGVTVAGGLRKFIDGLPGLGAGAANDLGQYIPVAVPDTTTYPGSDYYEIELVQYTEKMHADLPATTLRGYRQANMGGTPPHYMGPAIVATKDRPVRILFRNLLPTGAGGDLFLPVDTTVMGAGMGPMMYDPATGEMMAEPDPQNPMCGMSPKPQGCYTENRATLHLHGGINPWISDGTPHQWITPAGENTPYPKGVSVQDVPDMPDPGPGAMTFFFTNQQSARLMFYHDHAYGITRLNVYAGEAAPYIITDPTEQALVAGGTIPGPVDTIPLVIQDKTFVPSPGQLTRQDETWDAARWGGEGSLWVPHVYSPAQNPGDASGVNQFGRWAYGPWFWPPTADIKYGPIPNPYYDPTCDPDAQWCEPPVMPGTPFVSMGMEAFNDTPVVNGTAYPTITLDAKPYRFRILNAANDRFFNLHFYTAVDADGVPCGPANTAPAAEASGVACTEVALDPAQVAGALADPAGVFPTPVAGTEGPSWIQLATEGGFLPAPAVIPPQPITWVTDPTVFNAGNVDKHSLLIGPAERADVVVDFSQFAGQTLILYNDAPAAFPARDPRYDYYTGDADLQDTGGAPSTIAGYGPNTRTIMQVKISNTQGAPFDLAALQGAFAHQLDASGQPAGVFESSQPPTIVGQQAYNSAYGTAFTGNEGLVQIYDTRLTFRNLSGASLTMPLQPKMIQDEMGEAFEHDYGRMSGMLGVESPNAQAGLQNMILYPYLYPPTEVIEGLPPGVAATPIASTSDGAQIWKITHNGVDTHPVHFHLYDVQLVNRVGWDGIIRKPDPNEIGWKDTVRISPLEDTIVALRPRVPTVPFDLPNSIRLLDPTLPEGAYLPNANSTAQNAAGLPLYAFNPDGEPIDITNHYVNYGWEYVWHCHILSHEEMDMMRAQAVAVAPQAPAALTATRVGSGRNQRVEIRWTDASTNETSFSVERATNLVDGGNWGAVATLASDRTTGPAANRALLYTDRIGNTSQVFFYRVVALNTVGDTADYSDPALNNIPAGGGFPTRTTTAAAGPVSWDGVSTTFPAAPSGVVATAAPHGHAARVTLSWVDNASDESGFEIQSATDDAFTAGLSTSTVAANATVFTTGNVASGANLYFRVRAVNAAGPSAWANATPFPILTP
jgi:FtsP/CotA-like multicopper oxidase with cupredoxin domain